MSAARLRHARNRATNPWRETCGTTPPHSERLQPHLPHATVRSLELAQNLRSSAEPRTACGACAREPRRRCRGHSVISTRQVKRREEGRATVGGCGLHGRRQLLAVLLKWCLGQSQRRRCFAVTTPSRRIPPRPAANGSSSNTKQESSSAAGTRSWGGAPVRRSETGILGWLAKQSVA